MIWREFFSKNQYNEQVIEEENKVEQETRGMMSSPFCPRTRAKNQNNTIMHESEISIMSIPRRFRNKSLVEINSKEKEVLIVDTCSTEKQTKDNIEKEVLEKYSYYGDVAATSFVKNTQELENELHLRKIRELTNQLEINKILERHLKEEKKTSKKNNVNLVKENENLTEEIGRLKRKNDLICKQSFKWLKEKNMSKAKYEK